VRRSLIGLLVVAVAPGTAKTPQVSTSSWETASAGSYLVSHPLDWYVARAGSVTVLSPRVGVRAKTPPHRVRLPRDSAYVWVVAYPSPVEPLRADGGLGTRGSYDCGFGEGYMRWFDRGGRSFQTFAKLGARATPRTRATVVAVLDSVRPIPRVRWRRSRPIGAPDAGRLIGGVQLASEGRHFFTWDPVLRRSPNRGWRRFGSDRLVRVVLRVLAEFARANPGAPRVGVGDLSRPRGGDFGVRFGWPGHVSHQNGLDVDIYYPRRDRLERPPHRPSQIDRPLAQDLVDRFVGAGAVRVFVGPRTGLRGDPRIVQRLVRHDNHLHVRIAE
jgi:hypothetical protein